MRKNIIWDVDGTLFDTYPAIARAFQIALKDLGSDAALEKIEALARRSMDECIRTLAIECALDSADIQARFAANYAEMDSEYEQPFPGVVAVCEHVCSVGGKNVIVTHRSRRGTERLLQSNRMSGYFAGWLSADDGYPRKPDPAAFIAAIQLHGLVRVETLTVGDRDLDIEAGRAAGVFTVRFGADSLEAPADLTIREYSELHQALAPMPH